MGHVGSRSMHLGPNDVRGMLAFKEEYPKAQYLFVPPCKQRENYRGFSVVTIEEFLLNILPENLIFPMV